MMKKLENEYKERFQHQEITDNNDLADELWDAISDQLSQTGKQKRYRIGYFWLLIYFHVILAGYSYLLTFSPAEPIATENEILSPTNHDQKNFGEGNIPSNSNPAGTNIQIDQPVVNTENLKMDSPNEIKGTTPRHLNNHTKADVYSANQRTTDKAENNKAPTIEMPPPHTPFGPKKATPGSELVSSTSTSPEKPHTFKVEFRGGRVTETLPSISPQLLAIENALLKLGTIIPNYSFKVPAENRQQKLRWEIGLFGGINQLNFQYRTSASADLINIKELSEFSQFGTSMGATVNALMHNKWLVGTGVEYHAYGNKFAIEQQTFGQVLAEDQLLTVWLDTPTGDTLNLRFGDTLVNETTIRNVVNYNTFRQISIPIEVGWQNAAEQWLYGIMVGGVLNFTTGQAGKALNFSGEIAEINSENGLTPFKTFTLGLRASPFVGYQLNDNLSLRLRAQLMLQNSGYPDDQTDISSRLWLSSLNIGVSYLLD